MAVALCFGFSLRVFTHTHERGKLFRPSVGLRTRCFMNCLVEFQQIYICGAFGDRHELFRHSGVKTLKHRLDCMALNTLKCNHLTPLHFKGLKGQRWSHHRTKYDYEFISHTTKHRSTDMQRTSIQVKWIKRSQCNPDNNPEKTIKRHTRTMWANVLRELQCSLTIETR